MMFQFTAASPSGTLVGGTKQNTIETNDSVTSDTTLRFKGIILRAEIGLRWMRVPQRPPADRSWRQVRAPADLDRIFRLSCLPTAAHSQVPTNCLQDYARAWFSSRTRPLACARCISIDLMTEGNGADSHSVHMQLTNIVINRKEPRVQCSLYQQKKKN